MIELNDRDVKVQRELGEIQATMEHFTTRLDKMEAKVDKIYEIVTSTSGGWKMLLSVVAMTAAITTALNNLGAIGRFFNGS